MIKVFDNGVLKIGTLEIEIHDIHFEREALTMSFDGLDKRQRPFLVTAVFRGSKEELETVVPKERLDEAKALVMVELVERLTRTQKALERAELTLRKYSEFEDYVDGESYAASNCLSEVDAIKRGEK